MLKTVQLALRILRKNPVFTAIAVLTIALGVGASTAIFSVTDAVLLRPLPYTKPEQLVIGGMDLQKRNVHGLPFSNADYLDLKNGTRGQFSDMAGVFSFKVVGEKSDGTPERFTLAQVTTNFFDLMGAKIFAGRDFDLQDGIPQPPAPAGQDAQGQGAAPPPQQLPLMAILSHEYFMKRFGGNPAVLGHTLGNASGPNPVVVGVLAPGFRLYFPPEDQIDAAPDVWVANRLDYDAANRNNFGIAPVARLRQGVTLQQAQEAADAVAAESRRLYPTNASVGDRGADGLGDLSVTDCVRKRGESAAGAGIAARARIRDPGGDGREPGAADCAAVYRGMPAGGGGHGPRSGPGVGGDSRAAASGSGESAADGFHWD
jgi:putative ABC transport system permease protein